MLVGSFQKGSFYIKGNFVTEFFNYLIMFLCINLLPLLEREKEWD